MAAPAAGRGRSSSGTPDPAPATPPGTGSGGVDDTVRTLIALAITLSGLVGILLFWVYRSSADAEAFSALMSGLMGVVLGYYFGAHGKQASDAAAHQATGDANRVKSAAGKAQVMIAEARARLEEQQHATTRSGMVAGDAGVAAGSGRALESLRGAEQALDEV